MISRCIARLACSRALTAEGLARPTASATASSWSNGIELELRDELEDRRLMPLRSQAKLHRQLVEERREQLRSVHGQGGEVDRGDLVIASSSRSAAAVRSVHPPRRTPRRGRLAEDSLHDGLDLLALVSLEPGGGRKPVEAISRASWGR